MVESFCSSHQRTREMIDLLTSFLAQLGKAGEAAAEFVALYQVSPSIIINTKRTFRDTLSLVARFVTEAAKILMLTFVIALSCITLKLRMVNVSTI